MDAYNRDGRILLRLSLEETAALSEEQLGFLDQVAVQWLFAEKPPGHRWFFMPEMWPLVCEKITIPDNLRDADRIPPY